MNEGQNFGPLLKDMLTAAVAEGGALDASQIWLFKHDEDLVISKDTVLGDLDKCDFSGYADVPAVYGTPHYTEDGHARVAAPYQFTLSATTTTNEVGFVGIVNEAGTRLERVWPLPGGPRMLNVAGEAITGTADYVLKVELE